MEAAYKRKIKEGKEFEGLFPRSKGTEITVIKGNATVEDTLQLIQQMISETIDDTKRIAPILKGTDLENTLNRIWNFVYWHFQYKKDKKFVEQVRRPSRSFADRKTGVDCDCYTVLISSILQNLGINHVLRVTKYNGNDRYSHIYIVVPKNGNTSQVDLNKDRNNYFVLDCVPDKFNYEAPNITGYMDVPRNFNSLSGLGIGEGGLRQTTVVPLNQLVLPDLSETAATQSTGETTNLVPSSPSPSISLEDSLKQSGKNLPGNNVVNSSSTTQSTDKKNSGGGIMIAMVLLSALTGIAIGGVVFSNRK